ncbi:MAG TPA: YdeI/OmpD-associated family protein [Opitutus sp.]|nr:YdeI/OmpD-associated family protein [Opitutus sp.]
MPAVPKPTFFATAAAFRAWLEKNHGSATEIFVALRKQSAPPPGLTYAEALDEALCFGWIDGIARRIDDQSYCQRFTPRKRGSIWSLRNIAYVKRLAAAGRMHAAGLAAFEARNPARTGIYSFEQKPQAFPAALAKKFRANSPAWRFWTQQPPGYRRVATWWVVSAKQEPTRLRRLTQLIACSAAGRRLPGK